MAHLVCKDHGKRTLVTSGNMFHRENHERCSGTHLVFRGVVFGWSFAAECVRNGESISQWIADQVRYSNLMLAREAATDAVTRSKRRRSSR